MAYLHGFRCPFNEVPVVSLYNLLSMKLYVLKITFLVFENTCASVVQRIFSFLEFRILPPSEFILFRKLLASESFLF